MKMTVLPPKLEKWLLRKTYELIVMRSSKLYGHKDAGLKTNQDERINYADETRSAYDLVLENVWFYTACYAIGSSLASLPFTVHKKKLFEDSKTVEWIQEEHHELNHLLAFPNADYTGDQLIEGTAWSLELSGLAFWEKVRDDKGKVIELYLLDPRNVEVIAGTRNNFIDRFDITINAKDKVPFKSEDIVFFRYHNPRSSYRGLSAAIPSGRAITTEVKADTYNEGFYDNSALPIAGLQSEGNRKVHQQEIDQVQREWDKLFKGPKKSHRIAIFNGFKWVDIQRTPKDMEFSKTKETTRTEILSAFGVPKTMVGLIGKDHSASKEEKKIFWENTIKPKAKLIQNTITQDLLYKEAQLSKNSVQTVENKLLKRRVLADFSKVDALQDDQEVRSRVAFNLTKALVFSINEARRNLFGVGPIKNNPTNIGDMVFVPNNMIPVHRIEEYVDAVLKNMSSKADAANNKPGKPGGPEDPSGGAGKKPGSSSSNKPAKKEMIYLNEKMESIILRIPVKAG